jgi:hypothetical protein
LRWYRDKSASFQKQPRETGDEYGNRPLILVQARDRGASVEQGIGDQRLSQDIDGIEFPIRLYDIQTGEIPDIGRVNRCSGKALELPFEYSVVDRRDLGPISRDIPISDGFNGLALGKMQLRRHENGSIAVTDPALSIPSSEPSCNLWIEKERGVLTPFLRHRSRNSPRESMKARESAFVPMQAKPFSWRIF